MKGVNLAEFEAGLIRRCLEGDEPAWASLFAVYHPGLLKAARQHLGPRAVDTNRVEETVAAVWCALVSRAAAPLRRFDPRRGTGLLSYLAGMVAREVRRSRRAEGRRERLPAALARRSQRARGLAPASDPPIDDFLATLDRRERQFCRAHLLGLPGVEAGPEPSQGYAWQLRHRILTKLRTYNDSRGRRPGHAAAICQVSAVTGQ
jgi:hypothetical protein